MQTGGLQNGVASFIFSNVPATSNATLGQSFTLNNSVALAVHGVELRSPANAAIAILSFSFTPLGGTDYNVDMNVYNPTASDISNVAYEIRYGYLQ